MSDTTRMKRFVQLRDQGMERFSAREQRVAITLNFCVTALEKLGGWASFAIFPADDLDEERYVAFVKQRFMCVSSQLQGFKKALSHLSEVSCKENCPDKEGIFPFERKDDWRKLTLKEKVSFVSKHFLTEGLTVKNLVMEEMSVIRKSIELLFRWSLRTMEDLEHVIDNTMIDELFFMIRGKLSRLLSDAGVFEEAADEVEKNMSKSNDHNKTNENALGKIPREPDLTRSLPLSTQSTPPETTLEVAIGKSDTNRKLANRENARSCESTPEPPFSPRPEILMSHPKINKDRKMSLKSKSANLLNTW